MSLGPNRTRPKKMVAPFKIIAECNADGVALYFVALIFATDHFHPGFHTGAKSFLFLQLCLHKLPLGVC